MIRRIDFAIDALFFSLGMRIGIDFKVSSLKRNNDLWHLQVKPEFMKIHGRVKRVALQLAHLEINGVNDLTIFHNNIEVKFLTIFE